MIDKFKEDVQLVEKFVSAKNSIATKYSIKAINYLMEEGILDTIIRIEKFATKAHDLLNTIQTQLQNSKRLAPIALNIWMDEIFYNYCDYNFKTGVATNGTIDVPLNKLTPYIHTYLVNCAVENDMLKEYIPQDFFDAY